MNHSDPWRYVCPNCGSTQVVKRFNRVSRTVKGGLSAGGPYYCRNCKGSIEGLKDKKTGKITA